MVVCIAPKLEKRNFGILFLQNKFKIQNSTQTNKLVQYETIQLIKNVT